MHATRNCSSLAIVLGILIIGLVVAPSLRAQDPDKMTPEQKKQYEEYQKKNAQIIKNNQVIRNLNADLNDARAANHDKRYDVAEALMLRDTGIKPDGELLWYELGVAQLGLMKWDAADASFKKAVDFSLASKKPSPELIGGAYAAEGEADARNNKPTIAINEYDLAAQTNPVKAGLYYSNEAVVFFNVGNAEAQAASADKAIRAAPSNPLPYYLKGQALAGKTTINSRTGTYTLPPGCAEAYQKYLELAPNGPYSAQSRAFLQAVQSKDPARFNANAPAAGQGNLKSKEEAQQRADAQQQDGLRQRQQQAQNAAPPTATSQTPAPANPPVARPAAPAISQSSAAKPATAANQPPAAVSKPASTEPAKSRTLSSQAVLSLLQQGLSPKRVTTLVNERGVTFSLTAPLEKQLRSAGADDALLLAVATHKKSQ